MIASRVFCYNSDTVYEEYSPITGLTFRRFGRVINVFSDGVTAKNINSVTVPDRFICRSTSVFLVDMRYNQKAYVALLGIRTDWAKIVVSYLPSYPVDNITAPDDGSLYFNITYMR